MDPLLLSLTTHTVHSREKFVCLFAFTYYFFVNKLFIKNNIQIDTNLPTSSLLPDCVLVVRMRA